MTALIPSSAASAAKLSLLGRGEHQTELRRVDAIRIGLGRGCTRFVLLRHFTERQRDGLLFALAPNREFRRATRSHVADLPGEVANIVDRLIVQRGDDIAREARCGSSLQTNAVCGLHGGYSSRCAQTAIQDAGISVSSPLLDGYDEPEILRSSSR